MNKKLTYRQQCFLSQFLDIYHEMDKPIHYSLVAERLGVGKVTAYEMLRLLGKRGLINAEYQTNPEQHGPGRSTVCFFPTPEAKSLIKELAGDSMDLENWRVAKERILHQLREGKADGYEALLADLMARIPGRKSPLIYITELIAAMLLAIAAIQENREVKKLINILKRIGLPGEISLNVLSGISLVFSTLEGINQQFSTQLLAQINKYETMLSQLSEKNRSQVSDFAREAIESIAD